ncbi:alpha-L-fucosidase [Clostridiaceae bacterium M8S5]|nr:alpha-L-fucosidase [Clostridiaceae bacterium M8S5]
MNKNYEKRFKHTAWFTNARFGMFIHWGLYAIPARGEWIRSMERISNEEYQQYFDEFNPTSYNPKKWAKLAKKAGMKYVIMTTKHHDGFCLFDSKLTEYKTTNTPAKRDLIKEYVEAFRAEGLKIGFYYSLIDWYHEDYPAYGDRIHPMRDNINYKNKKHNFSNYLEYLHGQVKELLTDYGKIDIIWFDFSYDDMAGEKWQATKLVNMVRMLQPGIIINNRLDEKANIEINDPPIYTGDFGSPEQIIPPEGIINAQGKPLPWEACITLNDNWGYKSDDNNYKSTKTIIRTLVECVSKNGNLLLNIGPDAKGNIPKKSIQILEEVGAWMSNNSDSIYNCGKSQLDKPEWGRYTASKNKIYAHIYDRGIGPVNFRNLKGKISKVRLVSDRSEIKLSDYWTTLDFPKDAFIDFASADLPNEIDTVVEITLK